MTLLYKPRPDPEGQPPPGVDRHDHLHRDALRNELADVEARGVLACARGFASFEVTPIRGEAARGRFSVIELLAEHERVVVVGGQGAGKTALMAHLALASERDDGATPIADLLPLLVSIELLEPHERLSVETLARLAPAAGADLIGRALAERRALILVDGLDQARGGLPALLESIHAFARAHPGNRFVVTTRPLPTGVPGYGRTALPDFLTTALLPPLAPSRVHPAYRFVGARSPERKAALYLERVDALLRASTPGPISGALSHREVRKLFVWLAGTLHQRRTYEIEAAHLLRVLEGALWCSPDGARLRIAVPGDSPPVRRLRRAPALALGLFEEIRTGSALLVERRPGWLAFADFVLQEVLAALKMAQGDLSYSIVESRHDRWWHGVIELAVGLPGVDSTETVRALLEADHGEASVVTVLAARCAEAAPGLPDRVRRTVTRRLEALVPPEHLFGADLLLEIGDVVAPALLHALPRCGPEERALSALVLGRMHHEPACGAILAMASDPTLIEAAVEWPVGGHDLQLTDKPVAAYALAGLMSLALVSRIGRKAFARALTRAPRAVVQDLHDHLDKKRNLKDRIGDEIFGEPDAEAERNPGVLFELEVQVYESLRRRGR